MHILHNGALRADSPHAGANGEIFGILRQMKETFETNLSESQKEENANQKAYEDLKAAKEAAKSKDKAKGGKTKLVQIFWRPLPMEQRKA